MALLFNEPVKKDRINPRRKGRRNSKRKKAQKEVKKRRIKLEEEVGKEIK
jgi:hypothetical protein